MHLLSPATLTKLRQRILPNQPFHADWQAFLARVDRWCVADEPLSSLSGGWIHNYICPVHWLPLEYDPASPKGHHCPAGDSWSEPKHDEAWLAWRHRQIADQVREVALAFAITGEATYLAEVERILTHYTSFYANFTGADTAKRGMVKGRVFNQALTEALWAAPLVHAFDLVADALAADLRSSIERDFLYPVANTMLNAQNEMIEKDHIESNYVAWFNAVLGCIGYAIQDDALVDSAIDGVAGFVNHLPASVLPDGFEYEISPYYHNFVLVAYLILAEAALANGRNLYTVRSQEGQSLQSMWRVLPRIMLPDGTIADLGDGSYWQESVYDRELIDVYEIAYARDSHPAVAATLKHAYSRLPKGRGHWNALLYGADSLAAKAHVVQNQYLPDSGVAMLHRGDKLTAVCTFGAYRGSHSHGDHLGLQVWPFSKDAGSVLYGLQVRRTWYQNSYAHNVLVIDGQTQKPFSHAEQAFSEQDGRAEIQLQAVDAYPEANVTRTVTSDDEKIVDTLVVTAETAHTYDWVFHVDGDLAVNNVDTQPATGVIGSAGVTPQITLTATAEAITEVDFTLTHHGESYLLTLQGEAAFDLLLGMCPGTSWNPTAKRHTIIGRTVGMAQRYHTTIKPC